MSKTAIALLVGFVFCVGGCGDDSGRSGTDGSVGEDGGAGRDAGLRDGQTVPDAADGTDGGGPCFNARLLWFDDFETGDYSRWTSSDYGADWHNGFCHDNGFSQDHAVSPSHSHRSEITCTSSESHRGYGGLQFDGDNVLPAYTNSGTGTEAPHGVVNTYWSWLEVPYAFGGGRWFSFWTVNSSCSWNETVITLGLENASNRLTPAHIVNTGGTVDFEPNAPGFPLGQWVRTTIYINYHSGVMHVWQDGTSLLHATFSRPSSDICQWHWGAYASGDNDDIVLYEDDNYIWKLEEAWTDFSTEPYFDMTVPVCSP